MPIMEISVVPLGTKTTSLSAYVACCVDVLGKEKGIAYELTAMGTIIEARSLKRLFAVAEKMHQSALKKGAGRVVTSIKIDERRDKKISIHGKVASVKRKLK